MRKFRQAPGSLSALALGLAAVSACTVGPDYQRPPVTTPAAFKELDGWKPSEPQLPASGTPWWSIYSDPVLDGLERQIDVSNQTLAASEAAFRQASAIVGEVRSGYFPTVTLGGSAQRFGQGKGATSSSTRVSRGGGAANSFSASADVTAWEIDIWGKIRRQVEAASSTAQADAALVASARLSEQALLATDYFELRVSDAVKRLLDDTVAAYTRTLEITQNRYATGVAARTDVATAQAQLEGTRAQSVAVGVQRAQLEHAIAVLIGKAPADFSLAPAPLRLDVPAVPPGLPSTLLERNPDIAAAERQVAAANAQIGVDIAAYYPSLTLSASFGFQSSAIENLLSVSHDVWSLGPSLAGTLIDGGLRSATVAAARAGYDQTVANYRQAVLTAFQGVEDQLAALRILEQQAQVQEGAVKAAQEAEQLTLNQYRAGTLAYTSVVTAQATALGDEENALTIMQSRLVASVALIKALGGGWEASQLPTRAQVEGGQAQSP